MGSGFFWSQKTRVYAHDGFCWGQNQGFLRWVLLDCLCMLMTGSAGGADTLLIRQAPDQALA